MQIDSTSYYNVRAEKKIFFKLIHVCGNYYRRHVLNVSMELMKSYILWSRDYVLEKLNSNLRHQMLIVDERISIVLMQKKDFSAMLYKKEW